VTLPVAVKVSPVPKATPEVGLRVRVAADEVMSPPLTAKSSAMVTSPVPRKE
jgi:hypothetical protein